MTTVTIVNGTVPHEVYAEFGGGKVLLKPASPGTGIIAGGGVRAVCEAAGVKDILAKSMGSSNHANVVKATIKALSGLRTRETILSSRGKKVAVKAI
jgi:small subunit ribosomal protein S5